MTAFLVTGISDSLLDASTASVMISDLYLYHVIRLQASVNVFLGTLENNVITALKDTSERILSLAAKLVSVISTEPKIAPRKFVHATQ